MIHFDTGIGFFACRFIVNHDLAGKQFGHTRGVVLDDEFFKFNRKRQVLQQHTRGLLQDGCASGLPLRHQKIGSEGGIAL